MLRIAICDDIISICSELEKMLNIYADSIYEKFEIELYFTGKKLCEDLQAGICFDLIMLDIEMPEVNGVDAGRFIRNELKNNDVSLIYISSHANYAMELFQVRPFDFLIKPLRMEEISRVMGDFIHIAGKTPKIFRYVKGRTEIKAYIKDILYFTIRGRIIEMVTVSKRESFYGKLADIGAELESRQFFYANKSQLVNYNRVREFYYDSIVMEDETVINISQGRRKAVQQLQREYSEYEVR